MEFGTEKWATSIFKRVKLPKADYIVINEHVVLKNIKDDESYKYASLTVYNSQSNEGKCTVELEK